MNCVICGNRFSGHGNNAQPLAEGLCCDKCNIKVITERIKKAKHIEEVIDSLKSLKKSVHRINKEKVI